MARHKRLSGAIIARPEWYTAAELVRAAEELLREQAGSAATGRLPPSVIAFYEERGLVDPPQDASVERPYTRRHLMQLMAVQVLRRIDLGLDEIASLVRGVDDKNLKLLIDDPEEAEKKANVMRNWLGVIARGRYNGDGPPDDEALLDNDDSAPFIQPSRVPLVPNNGPSQRGKRTILGNPSKPGKPGLDMPPDLPVAARDGSTRRAKPKAARRTMPRRADFGSEGPAPTLPGRVALSESVAGEAELFVRHRLMDGVELHVEIEVMQARLDPADLTTLFERIRALLQVEDD